jgi:tripartite-type tricarboxylate transporter receptor subunit TctC
MRASAILALLTILGASLGCPDRAGAQSGSSSYPTRTVRIIHPLGAGSPPDVVTRAIAVSLSKTMGQPFVVENRVGANGIIAMEACARAAPDGYTLCAAPISQMSTNPLLYKKLPYEPLRDFSPVALVGAITSSISVHPSLGVNSLEQLASLAKTRPGAINWGSWGVGSFSHLYLAWFESTTDTSFTHIPYKTVAQAMTALLTGEIQVLINTPRTAEPFVIENKMTMLAVIGKDRYAGLPKVPTLRESGYDQPLTSWFGIVAPTGVSRDIVGRLNAEIGKLLSDPAFVERHLIPAAHEPLGGSPEEFAAFLRVDRTNAERVVRDARIEPE